MPFKIQWATTNHLEEIAEQIRQTSLWLKTKGIDQWSDHFPISRLEQEVENGELFVILDVEGAVMGSLSLSKNKGDLWPEDSVSAFHLNRLVIARKYAGQNLGPKVIHWVKDYSIQQSMNILRLNCDQTNPFLPQFYRSCGFKCIGDFYYPPWKMTFDLFEIKL